MAELKSRAPGDYCCHAGINVVAKSVAASSAIEDDSSASSSTVDPVGLEGESSCIADAVERNSDNEEELAELSRALAIPISVQD